jgi:signal transduction histidine kinase
VLALAEDEQGRLWVGSDSGLSVVENGAARTIAGERGPVRAIRVDDAGSVWVGGARGLARLVGDRLVSVAGPSGPDNEVLAITVARGGGLWVGSESGLTRVSGDRLTRLGQREGLLEDAVHQVLEDARGDLWLGGARGVAHVPRARIEEFLTGRRSDVEPSVYGTAEGLPATEISRGSQPEGVVSRNGTLLFATTHGVAILDPTRGWTPFPLHVVVERAFADGREHTGTGWTAEAGVASLEFRYTAPVLVSSGRLKFRYRLLGYSAAWTDAGPRRMAIFTRVPAGHYVFEVEAALRGAPDSPARAASMPFEVAPLWHERGSVRLLLAGLAVFLVVIAYRVRVASLLTQERRVATAVWEERQNVSRELHDSVNQLLFGLTLTAEAALDTPESPRALVARVLELGRAALAQMRRLMTDLQAGGDRLEPTPLDITSLLTRYATALAGTDLRLSVRSCYRSRDPVFDHELLRIGQEAINNAVRHARAQNLWIALSDADGVHLRIEDDGIGLPEKAQPSGSGTGIPSMERRARFIGARFALSRRPQGGTVVDVLFRPSTGESAAP